MTDDAAMFESNRPALLALAYRMLGEMARAEDVIQEAWVRWQQRKTEVDEPKAFLITTVARLCLDELGSARARREESRSDRLPEPVDLDETSRRCSRCSPKTRCSSPTVAPASGATGACATSADRLSERAGSPR